MWCLFTAKHNLAILNSDHATKLFKEMFPDSEIDKNFAWGHTKMTAIVKEGIPLLFSILMMSLMTI